MNLHLKWALRVIGSGVLVLGILYPFVAFAQCPSEAKIQEGFRKAFGRDAKVLGVERSAVPFLCEAQVNVGGRNDVLYTDSEGYYLIRGPLFDAQNGSNLTQETLTRLNRLSDEEMKRLESLVAFSSGTAHAVVYFVADPECPYCETALVTLKKLMSEGKLTVKFLLYPLPMHEGAEEQSVAIICDRKGVDGLETKYHSDNQCAEGKEKVRLTISFLKEKGIMGTPTYIFRDGTYHMGLLNENAFLKELSSSGSF